ncbi:putative proteolipid membrane potential modulator [Helianthus debilis subsp. tardiflorus]
MLYGKGTGRKSVIVGKMSTKDTLNCIDVIPVIILSPLGIFFKFGCYVRFWICMLLTLFRWIPGFVYAIYAIT